MYRFFSPPCSIIISGQYPDYGIKYPCGKVMYEVWDRSTLDQQKFYLFCVNVRCNNYNINHSKTVNEKGAGGLARNPKMSEWRSVASQLLSSEWGAVEVSISVSQLPGFRPPAIPGARAAFHAVVSARLLPIITQHHTLKSHKVSGGLRLSKNTEWLQHAEGVMMGDELGEVEEGRLKKANRELLWKKISRSFVTHRPSWLIGVSQIN